MTERDFAIDVVRRLREADFQALWAGGCVRDQLLGLSPKDFDVATDARPDDVQRLFRRTVAVGASFGVVEVLGPPPLKVQVATFRADVSYSDGRRPDAVVFTSAREDALRRDFTINGMFFDPLENQVIDYVGGQKDLEARIDRKSTRLNSSHLGISYAVFCVKKKPTVHSRPLRSGRLQRGDHTNA